MSEISESTPTVQTSGKSPFSLGGIIISSTIFSPVTGGIMAAENWRRLGRPQNAAVAVLVGLVGFIVIVAILVWSQNNLIGVTTQFGLIIPVDALFGVLLSVMQRPAYNEWVAANGGVKPSLRRSGCWSYLVIVVLSVVIAYVVELVAQPLVTQVAAQLQRPQTFSDNGISVTLPAGWINTTSQADQQDLCKQANQQCIALAAHVIDDLSTNFVRFNSPAFMAAIPKDIDTSVWAAVEQQDPTAKEISTQALKVDGRDGYERIYSYVDAGTNRTRELVFIKEDSGAVVRLDVVGSTPAFNSDRSEIDNIVSNIRFATPKAS